MIKAYHHWQRESYIGPFSLELSLFCGQAFRWIKNQDSFIGIFGSDLVEVRQSPDLIEWRVINSLNSSPSFDAKGYFSLDLDFNTCLKEITKDKLMKKATDKFSGLRVLRQNPWETTISYLCSANAPVFRIRGMIEALSQKWGQRISADGFKSPFYSFPEANSLAKADLQELRECGVGFRDARIIKMAKTVASGELDLESLKKKSYPEARACLLAQYGIGPKIADCICAFGLAHWEAFPTDVWIRRVVQKYYLAKSASVKDVEAFGREYFGRFAAIAQEYLFHFARTSLSTKKISV
ncbi:MAG: DNA-3-methyladenine glycosylase family protein [Candidatus Hodarchaeota archaeon]